MEVEVVVVVEVAVVAMVAVVMVHGGASRAAPQS